MVGEVVARLRLDRHVERAAVGHQSRHEPRELSRRERDLPRDFEAPMAAGARGPALVDRHLPDHRGNGAESPPELPSHPDRPVGVGHQRLLGG